MEQIKLGDSGLSVSKVIIGCMSFGSKDWLAWVEDDEEKAFEMLNKAYENGIRTFDTANVYSNGISEKILGKWIKKYNINRGKIVVMSKCFFPVDDTKGGEHFGKFEPLEVVNKTGLSRKNIIDSVQGSVDRLGTYIDLLQIHRFDKSTPKKEIMKALNDVVDMGLARYIGASAMKAVEFAELQFIADKYDYHKFISMQSYYNLLYREDERELNHFCANSDLGKVGLVPYSPLARGFLARPLGSDSTTREGVDKGINARYGLADLADHEVEIIKRVEELAKKYDVCMAAIGIAWLWVKGACPIVGVSSASRIDDYMQALKVKLTDDEIKNLEELYQPKKNLM